MKNGEKVLIIKAGYSEILDKESNSRKVSLGDVLRTTVILNLYKDDEVTWISDEEALPLLNGNPYIDRLLILNFENAMHLLEEDDFDTVINLEKNHDICKFVGKISNAWKRYGFRYDKKTEKAEAYDRAFETLALSSDPVIKKENLRTAQEFLFGMVGREWSGEEYILGYKPKTEEKYEVALNTQVGQKWPTKAWPIEKWDRLEEMLKRDGLKITRQDKQGKESPDILKNLYAYMDWLNSSRIIVSNDSLGLHLGIAMKKKVLGLFGATPYREVYFYDRGKAILPEPLPECLPCLEGVCRRGRNCIEDISSERVCKEVKSYINS